MKTRILIFLTAVLFLASILSATAQQDTSRKGKFQKVVKEKFMERVGVDEKTTDKFMESMKNHKNEMKSLQQKRKTLTQEITDNPGSTDIQSKLDDLLDVEYKMYTSRKGFYNELKTFMNAEQIAKTMTFQKDMKDFMKKNKKGKNRKGKDFNRQDDEGPGPGPGSDFPD